MGIITVISGSRISSDSSNSFDSKLVVHDNETKLPNKENLMA